MQNKKNGFSYFISTHDFLHPQIQLAAQED